MAEKKTSTSSRSTSSKKPTTSERLDELETKAESAQGHITPEGDPTAESVAGHKLTHSDEIPGQTGGELQTTDEPVDPDDDPAVASFEPADFYNVVHEDNHYDLFMRRGYYAASRFSEPFKFGRKKYKEGGVVVIPQNQEEEPFVVDVDTFDREFAVVTPTKTVA